MKFKFLKASLFGLVLSVSGLAQAGLMLQVNGDGQLTGATGVSVSGLLYDVQFVDGTCAALFGGCDDNSDFLFQTEIQAIAASSSLMDQVFRDVTLGMFDTKTELTAGCSDIGRCFIFTPYETTTRSGYDDNTGMDVLRDAVKASLLINFSDRFAVRAKVQVSRTLFDDQNLNRSSVYARWSPVKVTEPSILAIFALGMIGLATRRL
jgi:hypothetical protein